MKRSIIFFIVLLAVQCGWSQETGYWTLPSKNIDGLNYFLFEETGEVMMADDNCWEGELEIPRVVNWDGDDYPVKYFASRAFADCKALTRVIIPETVQNIRFYSDYLGETCVIKSPFYGCTQLESIEVAENNQWLCSMDGVLYNHEKTHLFNYPPGAGRSHYAIPKGVEAIGTAAFRGSINLTSVSIPNTVTQIFEEAFYDCDNLEQISLSDNISIIRLSTFRGCSKLKSIHLPDNLTEIENVAFFDCSSLKEIVFPEKLQTLGYRIFQGCQLETVVIKGSLYDYSIKNLLQDLGESATLYVLASEVDRYKNLYSGTVLPLGEYNESTIQEYFPEGTKWTEIRLDTLKHDSWYSKVGDEWVPNFETIEYYVQGEYQAWDAVFKKVYSNGPEWTDNLAFLLHESEQNVEMTAIEDGFVMWPAEIYQFDWNVGKGLYYRDILESNSTGEFPIYFFFGVINEIKEGDFGGVRPLKYVDLDGKAPDNTSADWDWGYTDARGGRIIQGVGITEWNNGECLFGPPFSAMTGRYGDRHYRSMLVHFERNNEVLYDVWPEKVETGIENVYCSELSPSGTFDLQGRLLSNKPSQGIYIEDGQKRARK